jgi:hypothetical protein
MVFNWAALIIPCPSRFAGTWKIYSKRAINQAIRITFQSTTCLYFRCPYQANVINILEIIRRMIVRINKKTLLIAKACKCSKVFN